MAKIYKPKRMLVTGGAGFIGCNFIRFVLSEFTDVEIVNLDALTYAGSLGNLEDLPQPDKHHFVHGNIADKQLVKGIFSEYEIDTVVHFAAESHVDRSIIEPSAFVETNIVGTFTLLEAARDYWMNERKWGVENCRFHHVSTDEVYGSLGRDDSPFSEQSPYLPSSPYSASKAAADHMVRAYCHTYGLPVTISNCSNNYGPFQHQEKFIPTIIRSCIEGKPIPVYGDGSNIRDWLHVLDHCAGIILVIQKGQVGETYNIGGDNEWKNLSIVKLICSLMDSFRPAGAPHDKLITFVKDRPGHDWRYSIDSTKIKKELGWKPEKDFRTGLKETTKWYLERRPWDKS